MIDLFPKLRAPYFIWSYPWTHESSGARALHLLCHALNESGERAYLMPVNKIFYVNYDLRTPLVDEGINMFYTARDIEPIVIYPDIVQDNPMRARKVVRWLLAPAGAYGGNKVFPVTDKIYGYTNDIFDPVLCLPTFDSEIFFPPPDFIKREGCCFYSHKYDKIHGNSLLPVTSGMRRCEGDADQVAQILRTSEKCYIYERSEIAVTALMCGCQVEPVITPYFDGKFPEEFIDADGTLVPGQVLHDNFERQLKYFIFDTQGVWK